MRKQLTVNMPKGVRKRNRIATAVYGLHPPELSTFRIYRAKDAAELLSRQEESAISQQRSQEHLADVFVPFCSNSTDDELQGSVIYFRALSPEVELLSASFDGAGVDPE